MIYPLVVADSYAQLLVGLNDYKQAGADEVIGELYAKGQFEPGGKIGEFKWEAGGGGLYRPVDEVRLDRVTASQYGQFESSPTWDRDWETSS